MIDHSLPSTPNRLWVFDIADRELLYYQLVAHRNNTGGNMATRLERRGESPDEPRAVPHRGHLRRQEPLFAPLPRLHPGVNHLALPRTIVIHGAWYVSDDFARWHGPMARNWGCPAPSENVARPLILTSKYGPLVFAYYSDQDWLGGSKFLAASCGAGAIAPSTVVAAR